MVAETADSYDMAETDDRSTPCQPGSTSWPLAALTVAEAAGWLWYGTSMFMLAHQPSATTDDTLGVNHYYVQGALAFALAGLAGLTVRWPRFRSWIGRCRGRCGRQ